MQYFDPKPYAAALLDGARIGFRMLQARHAGEHIYFYGLRTSSSYSTIAPCIRTEEGLDAEASPLLVPMLSRGRTATLGEVRLALRFDTPEGEYCARPAEIPALAAANEMLAEYGEKWDEIFNTLAADAEPPEGDEIDAAMHEAPRAVLRALDKEGLFGTGEARRAVVLDVCWTEGGMPDALMVLDAPEADWPSPLNPPDIQAAYLDTLAESRGIGRTLFG